MREKERALGVLSTPRGAPRAPSALPTPANTMWRDDEDVESGANYSPPHILACAQACLSA